MTDRDRSSHDRDRDREQDLHQLHQLYERYLTALREASGGAPARAVDGDAFHARLAERAALPLARLRGAGRAAPFPSAPPAWWEYAARWARMGLPVAVAAGVALFLYGGPHPAEPGEASVTSETAAEEAGIAHGRLDARWAFEAAVTGASSARAVVVTLVPAAGGGGPIE